MRSHLQRRQRQQQKQQRLCGYSCFWFLPTRLPWVCAPWRAKSKGH